MRQNNFNYKAFIWWNIRECFVELYYYSNCWYGVKLLQNCWIWHDCFIFKLFFCFGVYFLWWLFYVRSGCRCTVCCTVSSTRQIEKNVCTCLKSQPCGVVVLGQQAGILKSLVAPARLLLAAVSFEWAHREAC